MCFCSKSGSAGFSHCEIPIVSRVYLCATEMARQGCRDVLSFIIGKLPSDS